ncbi:MAG: hypothetical protein CL521_01705 [Actinobacteria bacterium]|nr:hypothetical protein [Actinomycetota bacterium]
MVINSRVKMPLNFAILLLSLCLFSLSCGRQSDDVSAATTVESDGYTILTQSKLPSMTLKWKIVDDTSIDIEVTGPTTGWVGVGFAPTTTEKMNGANLIIGYVSNGEVTISDRFGTGPTSQTEDTHANISQKSGSETASTTTISFRLPLDSSDAQDFTFVQGQKIDVLMAYGTGDAIQAHSQRARIDDVMIWD